MLELVRSMLKDKRISKTSKDLVNGCGLIVRMDSTAVDGRPARKPRRLLRAMFVLGASALSLLGGGMALWSAAALAGGSEKPVIGRAAEVTATTATLTGVLNPGAPSNWAGGR
jgi:hypothetical protein